LKGNTFSVLLSHKRLQTSTGSLQRHNGPYVFNASLLRYSPTLDVNIVQPLGKLLRQETLQINSAVVNTEAKDSQKCVLVPIYQNKQYHIPEQYLIIHHCKNQKPLTLLICAT
jgi:hypothetical protein